MAVLDLIAPDHVEPLTDHSHAQSASWTQAVRGEYLELPMLSLTRTQVQSLWDLDDEECGEVLDTLMACGFLKVTANGSFVRALETTEGAGETD